MIKTLKQPSPPALIDEGRIHSFSVGHGDCTLIEYLSQGEAVFRMLVDAGTKLPDPLIQHLKNNKRGDNKPDLDIVVLTHVDQDHQGGLGDLLTENFTIGEYLGPCLPTFRRLKWLFASRIANAVDKAGNWEKSLSDAKVPITYPMEGYTQRFLDGRVVVSVISPAARVIERLSLAQGDELTSLFGRSPMPLEWLLEAVNDPDPNDDFNSFRQIFRTRTSLTPEELQGLPRSQKDDLSPPIDPAQSMQGADFVPEFFGNAVLNDTSLITVVDLFLNGTNRKRILIAGDQENWSYVAAKHPTGLGVDILKAPHHGGRVYLEKNVEAAEQLYLWARPRTVIVSANGQHDLPRISFREAIRKVGSTLLCPNQRSREMLTAGLPAGDHKSCFQAFSCTPVKNRTIEVVSRATSEIANVPSCVQGSGHSGSAPIVVMTQSVVTPSEAFVRWTRGELEKHSQWILAELQGRHQNFLKHASTTNDPTAIKASRQPVNLSTIVSLARAVGRHDLAADPEPVLRFAKSQRLFWISKTPYRSYDGMSASLYRYPSKEELRLCEKWLRGIPQLFVRGHFSMNDVNNCDRIQLLASLDLTALEYLLAIQLSLPVEIVSTELLPALLPSVADTFSAKMCNLYNAYSSFSGGPAVSWLQSSQATQSLPDLAAGYKTFHGGNYLPRDNSLWSQLLLSAENGCLPAIYVQKDRSKGSNFEQTSSWTFDRTWTEAFERGSYPLLGNSDDDLQTRMKKASWSKLW
jgi:Metallo-beta-lactamase superfamily